MSWVDSDWFEWTCPKCEHSGQIEIIYLPWEDAKEKPIVCDRCGFKMKIICECTYTHKVITEIDGVDYDITDPYNDDFEEAQLLLNGGAEE